MAKSEKEVKEKKTTVAKSAKKADKVAKTPNPPAGGAKTAVKAVKETKVKKVAPVKETKIIEEAPVKAVKKSKKVTNEDTGSVSFQIENFTAKIKSLTKHLQEHSHDFDSRRGLLIMVGKRRRLLNYLKKNDMVEYEKAVKALKLKA